MRISDFFPAGGSANNFNLTAGAALAQNDTVLMGPDGLGYPVTCTDYAAVANTGDFTSVAQGQVVAPTSIIAAAYTALNMRRPKAIVDASGNNIILGNAGGSGGTPSDAKVYKYSPSGALLNTLALSSGLTGYMCGAYLFRLSNNNIAAVFQMYSAGIGYLYFAVCDENFNLIVTATAIEATVGITPFGACKLSGGGFAVSYTLNATPTLQRLAIYTNAGGVTFAPATVKTWAGTGGNTCTALAELSNGNIAFAVDSGASTDHGLYHAVYTPAGAAVVAFTNLENVLINNGLTPPEICAFGGYYAVAICNATNQKAHVFNNAGVLQGAPFSMASTIVAPLSSCLVNDGASFYLVWTRSTDTSTQLTALPVTGTGYVTNTITTSAAYASTDGGFDAVYERGNIIIIEGRETGTAPTLGVVTTGGRVKKTAVAVTATAPGVSGSKAISVTLMGTYGVLVCYDYTSTAGQFFMLGKYANSSILGSSAIAAAQGAITNIAQNAGSYPANTMGGTTPKLFDHSATNQYGNKGALMTNGIVLKGM